MTGKQTLERDDIVGKCVKAIYQSPWYMEPDGFGGCTPYIELDDGTAFALRSQEPGIVHPIDLVDLGKVEIAPLEVDVSNCIGRCVEEVLVSWYWPGMGLLLTGDILLYTTEFPNACRSGTLLIGPYAEPVSKTYQRHEMCPYWEQDRGYFDE